MAVQFHVLLQHWLCMQGAGCCNKRRSLGKPDAGTSKERKLDIALHIGGATSSLRLLHGETHIGCYVEQQAVCIRPASRPRVFEYVNLALTLAPRSLIL